MRPASHSPLRRWKQYRDACEVQGLKGYVRYMTPGGATVNDNRIPEYRNARVDIPSLVNAVHSALDGNWTSLEATYETRLAEEMTRRAREIKEITEKEKRETQNK